MFTFNMKLDDWVLRPVASGYSVIAPQPVCESVGRFFDNVRLIPRFANNLFQLKLAEAGGEVARFGISTTLGIAGFFDPADQWFGLKEHPNDFGLTIRYYNIPTGPYVMLPFFGPSTIGDTVGLVADGAMNPYPRRSPTRRRANEAAPLLPAQALSGGRLFAFALHRHVQAGGRRWSPTPLYLRALSR